MRGLALGQGFFDDLTAGVVSSVQQSATDWLVREYQTLRALPSRLRRLEQFRGRIANSFRSAAAVVHSSDENAVTLAGSTLAQLQATYPEMIATVDRGLAVVQQAAGGVLPRDTTSVLTSASVVYDGVQRARQFIAQVNTVDSSLKSVVNHLVATGALTEAEAQALNRASVTATPWVTYAVYAAGAFVGWKLLKAVL